MTQNQIIEWMDKKVALYKEITAIREIRTDGKWLCGCDYSTGEMQFSGDMNLFVALAATVGSEIRTEIRTDGYISMVFIYNGVRWFMLADNLLENVKSPLEKEDQ